MKIDEINSLKGSSYDRGIIAMGKILGIPLDDCSFEEFKATVAKINALTAVEDNGKILMEMARDTVSHSLRKAVSPEMSPEQVIMLAMQILIQYGFILGYYYRSNEIRKDGEMKWMK